MKETSLSLNESLLYSFTLTNFYVYSLEKDSYLKELVNVTFKLSGRSMDDNAMNILYPKMITNLPNKIIYLVFYRGVGVI
jgi:hypothetical protein